MIQQNFLPGDDWLYFKVYTGTTVADTILTDAIGQLAIKWLDEKAIDKWFFIRYSDPDFHLRVRFHVADKAKYGQLMHDFNIAFKPFVDNDLAWNIQINTYQRELKRYGADNYETFETLFYIESDAVVTLLEMIEGEEGEQIRWLFALKKIDNLLDFVFKTDVSKKLSFIKLLADSFAAEFNMDKQLRKQINKKYKANELMIASFLNTQYALPEYAPVYELLQKTNLRISNTLQKMHLPEQVVASVLHIGINRIFKSDNRLFELLMYQFLFLYYRKMANSIKTTT